MRSCSPERLEKIKLAIRRNLGSARVLAAAGALAIAAPLVGCGESINSSTEGREGETNTSAYHGYSEPGDEATDPESDRSSSTGESPNISKTEAEQMKELADCYGYPEEGFSSEEEEMEATAQVSQEQAIECIQEVTGKDVSNAP